MPGENPLPSAVTIAGPLLIGSQGAGVRTLQQLLNEAIRPQPSLAVDGIFGVKTDAAVRAFQSKKGLHADGIAGPLTIQALGAKFIGLPHQQAPPAPPTGRPAAPQGLLLSTIHKELKKIHQKIDLSFDNGSDEMPDTFNRARKLLKFAFRQADTMLAPAMAPGIPAQIAADAAMRAIFAVVAGLGAVVGELSKAGADIAEILGIMTGLQGAGFRISEIVRKSLEGHVPGGLKDGVRQIRDLLDPFAD